MANDSQLKKLTDREILDAYEHQCSSGQWSFSDEREFVENLFCQRFNFLLVAYSVVIAGAVATETQLLFNIILAAGFVITTITAATVWRAYVKLIAALRICYRIPTHPLPIVEKEVSTWSFAKRGFPVNKLLGLVLPSICSISLLIGTLLGFAGILGPRGRF